MQKPNMEIEKTYQAYLARIREIDLSRLSSDLGLIKHQNHHQVNFFRSVFSIRPEGFFSESGKQPPYDICIVLCKYLLMCPQTAPREDNYVAFRDFKASGPLTVYFSTDVEQLICKKFSGRLDRLAAQCRAAGGRPAAIDADYDLIMEFNALPKVPMVLLFNDRDEDFDAQAKVLYEQRAESYLDAECLAILGNLLYQTLSRQETP